MERDLICIDVNKTGSYAQIEFARMSAKLV